MKKFTRICMAVLMVALMSMTLVACGGGGSGSRLNTADSKVFAESFDVMYDALDDAERADLLYYFPLAMYKGAMGREFVKHLDMTGRPSDEALLLESSTMIASYKKSCRALFEFQAKKGGEVKGHNFKELNGMTAMKIIEKGKAALKTFREE